MHCFYLLSVRGVIQNPHIPLCPHPFFDHDLEPSNTTLPRHPLASCGSRGFMFLYLVCFSDRPLFELKEGQWWDMDWEYNSACQNMNERRSMSISDYGVSLSVGLKWPYRVICYRYRLDLRPGEHCKSKIVSGMKNFRCLSAARSHWKPGQLS